MPPHRLLLAARSRRRKRHFVADDALGEIARLCPAAIAVFEAFDLDYARKGGRTVRDTADGAGLDQADFLRRINATLPECDAADDDAESLARLVSTILPSHHHEDRKQLIRLNALLAEEPDSPSVERIRRLMAHTDKMMCAHRLREEEDLFPAIARLAASSRPAASIARRIYVEFAEHEIICGYLAMLRELRLRAMLEGCSEVLSAALQGFERQMLRHMHLENNVLHPKALAIENRLRESERGAQRPS